MTYGEFNCSVCGRLFDTNDRRSTRCPDHQLPMNSNEDVGGMDWKPCDNTAPHGLHVPCPGIPYRWPVSRMMRDGPSIEMEYLEMPPARDLYDFAMVSAYESYWRNWAEAQTDLKNIPDFPPVDERVDGVEMYRLSKAMGIDPPNVIDGAVIDRSEGPDGHI